MKKSTVRKYTDYFLLTFLLATTGFPFLYEDIEFLILGFLISFYIFLNRRLKYSKRLVFIFTLYFIVELFQTVYFQNFEPLTTIGTLIRILFGYYCVTVLDKSFFEYYFNIIYFFAIVSLFFYIPVLIDNSIGHFIVDNFTSFFDPPFTNNKESFYAAKPNIFFYCFERSLFTHSRNPGPFWEPGAFAIFLNLALMFKIVQTHKIFTRQNFLLIIVILTTTSTAGYIGLFILLLGHYITNKKIRATKYGLVLILLYGSTIAYVQLNFLGDKAKEDIELADETTTSRFGSALIDLQDFAENPIIGYGRGKTRYGGRETDFITVDQHRNNGLTQLLVTYGIIIFIVYFFFFYKNMVLYCNCLNFNNKFSLIMLLVLLFLGFSQGLFTRPFFYGLLFLNFDTMSQKNNFKSNNLNLNS